VILHLLLWMRCDCCVVAVDIAISCGCRTTVLDVVWLLWMFNVVVVNVVWLLWMLIGCCGCGVVVMDLEWLLWM